MYLHAYDEKNTNSGDIIAEAGNKNFAVGSWIRGENGIVRLYGVNNTSFHCKNDIEMTIAAKKIKILFFLKYGVNTEQILEDLFCNDDFYNGFEKGKQYIIDKILLNTKSKRTGCPVVYLKQAHKKGSKYCTFTCPICLCVADFKMTASVGNCNSCGTSFYNDNNIISFYDGENEYPNEISTIEIESVPLQNLTQEQFERYLLIKGKSY